MIKIDLIGGTRPNFVKIGPIYKEMKKYNNFFKPRFVHTGQHTDVCMTSSIWQKVGLSDYDIILNSNDFNSALDYMGTMIKDYNSLLSSNCPDAVLVVGDTDSSLIGALVAKRNNIPVIHVEAGLKGNINEPEQFNRSMIDSIANLMLTPTLKAYERLKRKRKSGHIVYVGNVMADSIRILLNSLEWQQMEMSKFDILVTLHRPYNVDNKSRLSSIINELNILANKYSIHFTIHPRTLKYLKKFGINQENYFHKPLAYHKFLKALSCCNIIITDSGGIQAEAAYLNVPCIGLMEKSSWPNIVDAGAVTLCPDPKKLNKIINQLIKKPKSKNVIDGLEGYAAKKICRSIIDWLNFEYKNKFV